MLAVGGCLLAVPLIAAFVADIPFHDKFSKTVQACQSTIASIAKLDSNSEPSASKTSSATSRSAADRQKTPRWNEYPSDAVPMARVNGLDAPATSDKSVPAYVPPVAAALGSVTMDTLRGSNDTPTCGTRELDHSVVGARYSPPDNASLNTTVLTSYQQASRPARQRTEPETSDPLAEISNRLRRMGAVYCCLESWGSDGQQFRFQCRVAMDGNPACTRHFEATAAQPLMAASKVLKLVESAEGY
jgi:hypothetical protein